MKLKYVAVYEETPNNYSAYLPDLPGCISTGKTWEDIQRMIREAVTLHIEAMLEQGESLRKAPCPWRRPWPTTANPLTEAEKESLSEYGDAPATLSTTFRVVEVEVSLSPQRRGADGHQHKSPRRLAAAAPGGRGGRRIQQCRQEGG